MQILAAVRWSAWAVLMIYGVVDCRPSYAQVAAVGRLKFEVASVKPNHKPPSEREGIGMQQGPDSLTAKNMTLKSLMLRAFEIKDFQLAGAPGWLDSDRFDIQAKAARPVSKDHLLQMLQSLLAERFKLAVHHES